MSAPFSPGDTLAGRYRLTALVQSSPTADIFLADDLSLTRPVAIHALPHALANDTQFLAAFRDEATKVAALNHPHILRVYDWGEEAGGAYLVTEYPTGGSLRQRLDTHVVQSETDVALWGLEIADALAYAHARDVVHGALSPLTIHFDGENRAKLADLGVAAAIARSYVGPTTDVRYASPEQAQRQTVTGATDVYALALIMYEALTGEIAHQRTSPYETLTARVGAPLPQHAKIRALDMVLAQAGAHDPQYRLDAATMTSRLQAVAGSLTVLSASAPPPISIVTPRPTPPKKNLGFQVPSADALRTATPPPPPPATLTEGIDSVRATGDHHLLPRPATETRPISPARRRRLVRTVAGVFVLAVGITVGGGYGMGWFTPTHPMPTITGLTQESALGALSPLKVTLKITGHSYSTTVTEGLIATQSVEAGIAVKEGSEVDVTISQGAAPVTIPTTIIGSDCAVATSMLATVNVTAACPSSAAVVSTSVPKGRVVRVRYNGTVNPPSVPAGSTVILVLSAGSTAPPSTTTTSTVPPNGHQPRVMPNLVGASKAAVYAKMKELQLYFVTHGPGSNDATWTSVVAQSPVPGKYIAWHGTVHLQVKK